MGSLAEQEVNVDFLVVGAGPAGASLAAFMAQNGTLSVLEREESQLLITILGLKGIVIARTTGTADTPRAHVFNPFALGILCSWRNSKGPPH